MEIFWVPFSKLQYASFFQEMTQWEKKGRVIFTPNPEMLLLAKSDAQFRELLKKADFKLPDGVGLYIAFQILDSKFPAWIDFLLLPLYILRVLFFKTHLYLKYGERICGSDVTKDIMAYAEKNNKKMAIIDLHNQSDEKKVASQKIFISKLQESFPNLQVSYYIWESWKEKEIIKNISESSAEFLFSTLGMKKQEENIIEVIKSCPNIRFGIWVGGSFDYFTWLQKRAPEWVRTLGFEWLYRLFFGPQKVKRLKRLWRAIIVFLYTVLTSKGQK